MIDEMATVLEPSPLPDFVETNYVKGVTNRALSYIKAGFPVHFRGSSGTGKTTLAMHIASKLKRPVVIIHGNEEYTSSDLVGGEYGYRMRRVVDRFISRVLKTEEDMVKRWVDNRLTVACKYGYTLVYDEFTRSRPEANNILLSILQEKIMDLPIGRGEEPYLRVHPDFTPLLPQIRKSMPASTGARMPFGTEWSRWTWTILIMTRRWRLPRPSRNSPDLMSRRS